MRFAEPRTWTYEKALVLQRLTQNREGHGAKVERALTRYHEMVVEEMEKRLAQARAGKPIDPNFLNRFPVPKNFDLEYDRAIDRVGNMINDVVELTEEEFLHWMRDEWDWTAQFVGSTQTYLVS